MTLKVTAFVTRSHFQWGFSLGRPPHLLRVALLLSWGATTGTAALPSPDSQTQSPVSFQPIQTGVLRKGSKFMLPGNVYYCKSSTMKPRILWEKYGWSCSCVDRSDPHSSFSLNFLISWFIPCMTSLHVHTFIKNINKIFTCICLPKMPFMKMKYF